MTARLNPRSLACYTKPLYLPTPSSLKLYPFTIPNSLQLPDTNSSGCPLLPCAFATFPSPLKTQYHLPLHSLVSPTLLPEPCAQYHPLKHIYIQSFTASTS